MGCNNTVVGNPPPPDAPSCAEFPDDNTASPTEDAPYKIGSVQDCVLTSATRDADDNVKLCEKHSDCESGDVCGKVGFCCSTETGECKTNVLWPNCALAENPDEVCRAGNAWDMMCMPSQVCGRAQGEQAACFAEAPNNVPCEEVQYCGAEDEITKQSEPAELSPNPVETGDTDVFPHQVDDDLEEGDTETEIPDIDSDPCPDTIDENGNVVIGKDADGNCNAGIYNKWCHYEAPDMPEAFVVDDKETKSEADSNDESNEKTSSFSFDPNFDWIYDIKPGPLGIPKPNLGVSAGVTATATMANLFGGSGKKEAILMNIALSLRLGLDPATNLCGLTTKNEDGSDSVVEILGLDFLPDSYKEKLIFPPQNTQQECIDKFGEFELLVNKVKKSMRDAEDLLKQYKKVRAEGGKFGNLCTKIVETIPVFEDTPEDERFPVDLKYTCDKEPPEETINRFVRYYNEKLMGKLEIKARELAEKVIDIHETPKLFEVGDEKEITLFNQTFMVGPVPANLEVFLSLAYGFRVNAYFDLTPATVLLEFLDLNEENNSNQIARVGITATPYLAARVGLFVGVGFDFGIAAIKAGIEGIVSLAEISLPTTAGVGVTFDAVKDNRALPPETMELFGDGSPLVFNVYPKKLQLSFFYEFDIKLAFSDILSGKINLKLKLKFLFFSKTWKKQIAKWTGFCPSNGDREPWCDIKLFQYKGKIPVDGLSIPWASIKLNTVFPQFTEIKQSEFVEPDDDQLPEMELNHSKAEKYHWDAQCIRGPI